MFANAKDALLLSEQVEGDTFKLTVFLPKKFLFFRYTKRQEMYMKAVPHAGDASGLMQAFQIMASLPTKPGQAGQPQITNVLNLAKAGQKRGR